MSGRLDVAIAGAGPAGSALALALARAGARVVLLDAARFPRAKPCGEAMGPGVTAALRRLGLPPLAGASPLLGIRLVGHGHEVSLRYRGDSSLAAGFGIERAVLDQALVAAAVHAGAQLRENTRVLALAPGPSLLVRNGSGAASISARVVVGAGGLACPVARALGGRRVDGRVALVAHLDQVAGLGAHGEAHLVGRGFVGIAPLAGGRANVAAVLDRSELTRARGRSAPELWRSAVAAAGLAERVARDAPGAALQATGPLGFAPGRLVADGVVVIGDAAGFVDPFTGDGVALALRSAELVAPIVLAALARSGGAGRDLAPWLACHRVIIAPRLRLDRALRLFASRPAVARRSLAALSARPDLGERLLAIPADLAPPGSLLAPDLLVPLARALARAGGRIRNAAPA